MRRSSSWRESLDRDTDKSGGPNACWLWRGTKIQTGYGRVRALGQKKAAHRAAWEEANGPIPAGMVICHRCDNPGCVNPAHLFAGTHQDNTRDMISKGRDRPWGKPSVKRASALDLYDPGEVPQSLSVDDLRLEVSTG